MLDPFELETDLKMATAPDISKLSRAQLLALTADIDRLISQTKEAELKALSDEYVRKGTESGYSIEELVQALKPHWPKPAGKRAAKKAAGPSETRVKFRDPKTGETWSGRGLVAKWLKAHEAAGRNRSEFEVK